MKRLHKRSHDGIWPKVLKAAREGRKGKGVEQLKEENQVKTAIFPEESGQNHSHTLTTPNPYI